MLPVAQYRIAAQTVLNRAVAQFSLGAPNQASVLTTKGVRRPEVGRAAAKANAAALDSEGVIAEMDKGNIRPYDFTLARMGWTFRVGRCDAQGLAAALLLAAYGAYPVDFMSARVGDSDRTSVGHGFAVTGRPSDKSDASPNSWGETAFVCDPWQGVWYPAHETLTRMWCGAQKTYNTYEPIGQSYGQETLAPARGDAAFACTTPSRFHSFASVYRFESDDDIIKSELGFWLLQLPRKLG